MALDFPTSPTVGQQYGGYVYDGTKWKVSTTSTAPASVQPTPPTNPTVGDMWFNSTDGTMYFYYNDGNTSQWVESRAPITANGYYSPNYFINGAFDIWQRGTSFSSQGMTADRWQSDTDKGVTNTQQIFTPGAAPVAGYEGTYFIRSAYGAAGSYGQLFQKIEDVRTLAGQTATLSFWAKVGSGTVSVIPGVYQSFGSGGSTTVAIDLTAQTLTTSWQRFSVTFSMPSVASKTIGANNYLAIAIGRVSGSSAVTMDIWGAQIEAGSAATTFRRNGNSTAEELAACMRYYQTGFILYDAGYVPANTPIGNSVSFPTTMRTAPTMAFSFTNTANCRAGTNRYITALGFGRVALSNSTAAMSGYDFYTADGEL